MMGGTGYMFYTNPASLIEKITSKDKIGVVNKLFATTNSKVKRKSANQFYYSYIKGDNLVHTPKESYMAELDIDLKKQDELFTTSNAISILTFHNQSKMRIGNSSKLKIKSFPRKKSGLYLFEMVNGEIMVDFSDVNKKSALKFKLDNFELYTREATLYIKKRRNLLTIALDYGSAKLTNTNTWKSYHISEAQGTLLKDGTLSRVRNYSWIDQINWDNYFEDLNKEGREGPFTMKIKMLSLRNQKRSKEKELNQKALARTKTNKKSPVRDKANINEQLDKAIAKSGGDLLGKLPFYGNKIQEIKNQINLNTDAMKSREQMLDDLDEN